MNLFGDFFAIEAQNETSENSFRYTIIKFSYPKILKKSRFLYNVRYSIAVLARI